MESIHGHKLMEWLGENGPLDREVLLRQASDVFGTESRFHTCSMADLTATALVDFLVAKGKIGSGEKGLFLAMAPCDH